MTGVRRSLDPDLWRVRCRPRLTIERVDKLLRSRRGRPLDRGLRRRYESDPGDEHTLGFYRMKDGRQGLTRADPPKLNLLKTPCPLSSFPSTTPPCPPGTSPNPAAESELALFPHAAFALAEMMGGEMGPEGPRLENVVVADVVFVRPCPPFPSLLIARPMADEPVPGEPTGPDGVGDPPKR